MNRGDLGFIAKGRSSAPNRNFFGGTGHPSKKGITAVSQTSKMNAFESEIMRPLESNSDGMISKRTEYLENQEKKMTATINETKSQTNQLNEKWQLEQQDIYQKLSELNKKTKVLFDDIQSVYGKISQHGLYGIQSNESEVESVLMKKGKEEKLSLIMDSGKWAFLIYPMQEIIVNESNIRCFMKCKTIDKITGQLDICWVLVYDNVNEKETHYISEFSLTPF